jgi:hypothetical protein
MSFHYRAFELSDKDNNTTFHIERCELLLSDSDSQSVPMVRQWLLLRKDNGDLTSVVHEGEHEYSEGELYTHMS